MTVSHSSMLAVGIFIALAAGSEATLGAHSDKVAEHVTATGDVEKQKNRKVKKKTEKLKKQNNRR